MPELACDVDPLIVPASAVTALLVDADRSFVQFAREELNQTGGQPVCLLHASTLAQASAIVAEVPVAVVLLDRTLPDGDGLEWLRLHRSKLEAGVVLLTGDHGSQAPAPLAPGAGGLLVKTHLSGDDLARAIRNAAQGERARRQLLESHEYFQSLIEYARDLTTVVDEAGCVVYQGPSVVALLGTPPHAQQGARFAQLVHPEDAAQAHALIEMALAGKPTPRGKLRLPHADGSMRTFDVVGSRITVAEEGAVVVLNARDVTERCQAEQAHNLREAQLRQAHKMEAVARLAGGVAHNFSDLLTAISSACARLQDDIAAGQAGLVDVQSILASCSRATALTGQLQTSLRAVLHDQGSQPGAGPGDPPLVAPLTPQPPI